MPCQCLVRACCPGKTTLLNHILQQNHGKQIAVIENEFGIAIDDALIKGKETLDKDSELAAQPEDVELTILEKNGCVWCTVRGDLVIAVQHLVERGGIDHLIFETTGVTACAVEH
jgi:G3E family GTPase